MVEAVLSTRDELDPDLEDALLEAIVVAEDSADGDGNAALRGIEQAVSDAIGRGVGRASMFTEEATKGMGIEEGG